MILTHSFFYYLKKYIFWRHPMRVGPILGCWGHKNKQDIALKMLQSGCHWEFWFFEEVFISCISLNSILQVPEQQTGSHLTGLPLAFSFFWKLQGCTVSTYVSPCIYYFWTLPFVKNNMDCSQFFFFSWCVFKCSCMQFHRNVSLIVSLKASVKMWTRHFM